MKYFLSIPILALMASCKHSQAGQTEAATFVLSDTMMASIRIDTATIRPVENELRLSGKVIPDMASSKPGDVRIMANAIETDTPRVKEGFPVDVTTISYPDKTFKGQIDKVYNVPDPDTKMVQVRIRLDDEDMLLKPEMSATVSLHFGEGAEMPAIPTSAVVFDKGKNFVVVFRDKYNIATREIEVFKSLNDISYISKGLQPGDKVISRNQLLIYDALNN